MNTDLIITDDFYQDVDAVREFALNQPFDVKGNYPGQRTKTFWDWPGLKDSIQHIVRNAGGEISYYESEYTSTFKYTTEKD